MAVSRRFCSARSVSHCTFMPISWTSTSTTARATGSRHTLQSTPVMPPWAKSNWHRSALPEASAARAPAAQADQSSLAAAGSADSPGANSRSAGDTINRAGAGAIASQSATWAGSTRRP